MGFKESLVHGCKKVGRAIYAKSPTLLAIGGTVGLVVAGVIACKETKEHFDDIIAEHREKVQLAKDIRDGVVELESAEGLEGDEKAYRKHLAYVYCCTLWKFVKCYFPAILLAGASVTGIFGGFGILNGWHKAAVAECYAYATTLTSYRGRMQNILGFEKEQEIFLDAERTVRTDTVTDPETGEEKEKSYETLVGKERKGPFSYICDESTMCSFAMYRSDADFRNGLYIKVRTAMEYLSRHDQITLYDLMRHFWNDEYLRKHSETFTHGWWADNPFTEPLDPICPITYDVKMISEPGQPRRYEVTFYPQGDIVHAMAAKREQERKERKFSKDIRTRVRPAV